MCVCVRSPLAQAYNLSCLASRGRGAVGCRDACVGSVHLRWGRGCRGARLVRGTAASLPTRRGLGAVAGTPIRLGSFPPDRRSAAPCCCREEGSSRQQPCGSSGLLQRPVDWSGREVSRLISPLVVLPLLTLRKFPLVRNCRSPDLLRRLARRLGWEGSRLVARSPLLCTCGEEGSTRWPSDLPPGG